MMMSPTLLESKFPQIGTTIFTVMSALANEHKAINLGQGFPDFACNPELVDAVYSAMKDDHNQYPPMAGILDLRKKIADKVESLYGKRYQPDSEITVTAGATQAILTVVLAVVRPGEEVIVIEPVYDSYVPAIDMAGGKTIALQMKPIHNQDGLVESYQLPWDDLAKAVNPKTRLIMINSPHNPTGMVWQAKDLDRLYELVKNSNTLICSDEVYEHMVFDGEQHQSIARHSELSKRSFLISSFGKTYHVTGWKVGYVCAPQELMQEFRKVHQFNVFTVNTPMQYGLTKYLDNPQAYLGLSTFYQQKRDYFQAGLKKTKFALLPSQGTYFQCVDYSQLSIPEAKLNETDFCTWLTKDIKVAAIPVSAFYGTPQNANVIRFCFAKKEETMRAAIERLQRL
jgi:methionine aminotransferase